MARMDIEFPGPVDFEVVLPVRITDINIEQAQRHPSGDRSGSVTQSSRLFLPASICDKDCHE